MKQILLEKGAVTLHDVPMPTIGAYEVLVVVYYSFIDSGSHRSIEDATVDDTFLSRVKRAFHVVGGNTHDTHKNNLANQSHNDLQVLGVSCAGQVIAVGSHVQHIAVGDWVACASAEYASHAELVSVPEHMVAVLHSKKHIRSASISAIGARALHALRRSQAQFGEYVAVVGLGLLGQLTVQLARMQGCKVIAIDVLANRRDLAKKLGAERVYDADDTHIVSHILRMTHHTGVDATIITASSTSSSIINQAAMITRKKGTVIVAGNINMACDRQLFSDKEIDVLLASSYGPGRFNPEYEQYSTDYPYAYVRWTAQRNLQAFVDAIESETIVIDDLITHEYELDEVEKAYQQVIRKTTVGVVLKYRYEEMQQASSQSKVVSLLPASRYDQDALRVGVIGIGSETERRLLPVLSKLDNLHISTLVDTNTTHVYRTGKQYNADYVSTDPAEVLASKYVEAVAIDDPAYMKDRYIFRQLEQGIGVFLTRMPQLTSQDVQKWRMYEQYYESAPLCMNLHRSFSSHVQKMTHAFSQRNGPMCVNYRIIMHDSSLYGYDNNAIIADSVHYIAQAVDLFITLTNQSIRSFSVLPMHASDISRWSNCIVHFTFEDGSICSLTLTSIGAQQAGSEYLELFCDGATVTLTDCMDLKGYGLEHFREQTVFDDGYDTLVSLFFEPYGLPEFATPISFNRIVTVAEITTAVQSHLNASMSQMGAYTSSHAGKSLQQ